MGAEVQLLRGDQQVGCVASPDPGGRVRVGRQPDNDLVVSDLSVSRFHAEIYRDDQGRLVYEDLGSGNGSFVDGQPVAGAVVLDAGVFVELGRHRLGEVSTRDHTAEVAAGGHTSLFEFALEEDLSPGSGLARDTGFSFEDALPAAEAAVPVPEGPDPLVAPDGPALYAGLVVQREGRLESVISWDRDRLCVGRGEDCEVRIDGPGVSRRHAILVREGQGFEVRDLDSINGTAVNGTAVRRRELEVGDVIAVGEFELTFLLDQRPIADEVQLEAPREGVAGAAEPALDMTSVSLLPGDVTTPGVAVGVTAFDDEPEPEPRSESTPRVEPAGFPPVGMAGEAPGSLFPDADEPEAAVAFEDAEAFDDEPEKPIPARLEDTHDPLGHVTPPVEELAGARTPGAVLEVRLDLATLPEPIRRALADPLRRALAELGDDLRIPLEVCLKRDD